MEKQTHGFLSAFHLKIIMLVLMTFDHLYYDLLPGITWAHIAARTVAPVFCYLMAEGMTYTRNRPRYILRMYAFGFAMLAGNGVIYFVSGEWITNSILLSLAIGATLIACTDRLHAVRGAWKLPYLAAIIALFLASIYVEGQYMIPLMAVIFYYMRRRPVLMWAIYFLVFCGPYLLLLPNFGRLPYQFWMILAVIPIACYSGKRGPGGPVSKYLFYVYYPLHIWGIFFIKHGLTA